MRPVRCEVCNKKLAEELDGDLVLTCSRCKNTNIFST